MFPQPTPNISGDLGDGLSVGFQFFHIARQSLIIDQQLQP